MPKGTKTKRTGCVSIEPVDGRYRLRFQYKGKRTVIYIGLPATANALPVARELASKLELDIWTDNVDTTFNKYRVKDKATGITVAEVFRLYADYKAQFVKHETLTNYNGTLKALNKYFGMRTAAALSKDDCIKFAVYYATVLQPRVAKERVSNICSAFTWAQERCFVKLNPWQGTASVIRVPPKRRPQPFALHELVVIIAKFRELYPQYADFIEVMVLTGIRPGELAAITWDDYDAEKHRLWIGKTRTRFGESRPPKANKERTLYLSERLVEVIERQPRTDERIFPLKPFVTS
jgi:integrase